MSNDQHIRKAGQKGWNNENPTEVSRLALKKETVEEIDILADTELTASGDYLPDPIVSVRDDKDREIDRLKSEIRQHKREADNWKRKYNLTHKQWWERVSESWSRKGQDVPHTIKSELERIRREWEAQNEN